MSCLCSETQHIWDVLSTCLCRCHSEENCAFANDFSSGTVTCADRIATSAMTSSCKDMQRWPNGFMKLSPVFSSAKASAIATAAVSSFIFIEFYWTSCWIRWCLHNWGRYSPQRVPSRDILWSHQWSHPCRSAQEDLPNGNLSHFRWIITRRDRKW